MAKRARIAASLAGACAALAGGFFLFRHHQQHRDDLPELSVPDISRENREAGHAEHVTGSAAFRGAVPADVSGPASTSAAAPGLSAEKDGASFFLGTFFQVAPKSFLQLLTTGNWIVGLDGDGEFVLEDARTNPEGTIHTAYWFVRRGTFRAKPHDYDPSDHRLEVRTPIARVYVGKAEIGMRVSEGGGGQIWLVSGKATIVWNDGRRKELTQKGMDYL
jgi:hypothetical protein